jgi:hypothetical protein
VLKKVGQISNKILVIKRRELVMAKNWSAAEAARVAFEGKNKEAIQDIGKRFPLFLSAASRGSEGLLEIIGALHPERITARTIEAKLKEGLEEDAEDVEEEETPAKPAKTEKKEKAEKPAAKKEKTSKKPAKVEEPEEDEDEDDEEEELPLEEMSLAELKAEAKKRKISVKGLKPKDIIKAIKAADAEEEDEEEDEDDDDWDI